MSQEICSLMASDRVAVAQAPAVELKGGVLERTGSGSRV